MADCEKGTSGHPRVHRVTVVAAEVRMGMHVLFSVILWLFWRRYMLFLAGRGSPDLLDMSGWPYDRPAPHAPLPVPQLCARLMYCKMAAAVCRDKVGACRKVIKGAIEDREAYRKPFLGLAYGPMGPGWAEHCKAAAQGKVCIPPTWARCSRQMPHNCKALAPWDDTLCRQT